MTTKLKTTSQKLTISLKLPKELEQHLNYLAIISKRPKEFIIQEALIQYLEHAEDVVKYSQKKPTKGTKTYTTEELLEQLNLKEVNV